MLLVEAQVVALQPLQPSALQPRPLRTHLGHPRLVRIRVRGRVRVRVRVRVRAP